MKVIEPRACHLSHKLIGQISGATDTLASLFYGTWNLVLLFWVLWSLEGILFNVRVDKDFYLPQLINISFASLFLVKKK